jgi:GTP cyclohydrolase I
MKSASSLANLSQPADGTACDVDIEVAFRAILSWIGEDPARDGLRDTPSRLRRAFAEYFSGYRQIFHHFSTSPTRARELLDNRAVDCVFQHCADEPQLFLDRPWP